MPFSSHPLLVKCSTHVCGNSQILYLYPVCRLCSGPLCPLAVLWLVEVLALAPAVHNNIDTSPQYTWIPWIISLYKWCIHVQVPCTGALKVRWGSSGRSGIVAGPRWLGYLLLLLEYLELVSGMVVQLSMQLFALQLALVIVEPPLGCGFALFIPLPFLNGRSMGVQHDVCMHVYISTIPYIPLLNVPSTER